MRDLDEDKKLKGRSNENRLSNGGCLGFGLDCGIVSGIRYQVSGIRERKGKGEGRDSMELREPSRWDRDRRNNDNALFFNACLMASRN